ncbi:hypothetical protein MM213_13160 [Belliella sp. R4-6]|uniref:Uncharacterized protein n=1 Tax=Belliella alkalica TaxID=1730871 RepID=A0ABS9VDD4_9BACT|nr:hypothetical protein [Belliella alkalica]MCH7414441.1 hypothetical protein [Belliella alkalica]
MERKCKNPTCSKPILGRSDKQFCCDGCRSAYFNDRKKEKVYDLYSVIPRIQKQNREILMVIFLKYGDQVRISKNYLNMIGYNFIYHTHTMIDSKGIFYQCCFEFAIRQLDAYWVEISHGLEGNNKFNSEFVKSM